MSAVMTAMLAEQDTTSETLERLEQKLDRLSVARFEQSLDAGLRFVREAEPAWRAPADRLSLLADARTRFIDAAAAAQNPAQRAIAEWHLGLVWLLLASPGDCLEAMERARSQSFRALLDARQSWLEPPEDDLRRQMRTTLSARLKAASTGAYDLVRRGEAVIEDKRFKARRELRILARPLIESSQQLVAGVQGTRDTLGVPITSCGVPRVLLPAEDEGWEQGAEAVVELEPGQNDVAGLEIGVHRVGLVRTAPDGLSPWLIDAEISLRMPASAPAARVRLLAEGAEVGGLDSFSGSPQEDLYRTMGGPEDHEWYDLPRPTVELPPFPRPYLVKSFPYTRAMIDIAPEQPTRGWVRLASREPPEQITFRLWPFGPRDPSTLSKEPGLIARWPFKRRHDGLPVVMEQERTLGRVPD